MNARTFVFRMLPSWGRIWKFGKAHDAATSRPQWLAHSLNMGERFVVDLQNPFPVIPRVGAYEGETLPGFSSIACANAICLNDVSGNRQRFYFGEQALHALNFSKLRPSHFLTP